MVVLSLFISFEQLVIFFIIRKYKIELGVYFCFFDWIDFNLYNKTNNISSIDIMQNPLTFRSIVTDKIYKKFSSTSY